MLIIYISIKVCYSSVSNAIHLFKQRWKQKLAGKICRRIYRIKIRCLTKQNNRVYAKVSGY